MNTIRPVNAPTGWRAAGAIGPEALDTGANLCGGTADAGSLQSGEVEELAPGKSSINRLARSSCAWAPPASSASATIAKRATPLITGRFLHLSLKLATRRGQMHPNRVAERSAEHCSASCAAIASRSNAPRSAQGRKARKFRGNLFRARSQFTLPEVRGNDQRRPKNRGLLASDRCDIGCIRPNGYPVLGVSPHPI